MVVSEKTRSRHTITQKERDYLVHGLQQAGGKLPLFDHNGQAISAQIIRACIAKGLAERWFANPLKPDWLVCRLTERGRQALQTG